MSKFVTTGPGIAVLVIGGVLLLSSNGQAQPVLDPETQTKVLKGFQIAPVPLNMVGLDPVLVGLGSYIVNSQSDCNVCHSAGNPTRFVPGGNPFYGQHKTENPATFLGGGRDFGAFPDAAGPHIISRNLTPDNTGLPIGGDSFSQFVQIIRTGIDLDHVHPTCSGPRDKTCILPPYNGDLLQIMPWPAFQNLTDRDLQAIYAFLSAIPCVEGGPGEPPNRCSSGVKTTAVAGPKNVTVTTRQIQLDGTQSVSGAGDTLTYLWITPQGSPAAGILAGNTATPTVQFAQGRGTYTFQLTVTDSAGNSATDFATVNFQGS